MRNKATRHLFLVTRCTSLISCFYKILPGLLANMQVRAGFFFASFLGFQPIDVTIQHSADFIILGAQIAVERLRTLSQIQRSADVIRGLIQ